MRWRVLKINQVASKKSNATTLPSMTCSASQPPGLDCGATILSFDERLCIASAMILWVKHSYFLSSLYSIYYVPVGVFLPEISFSSKREKRKLSHTTYKSNVTSSFYVLHCHKNGHSVQYLWWSICVGLSPVWSFIRIRELYLIYFSPYSMLDVGYRRHIFSSVHLCLSCTLLWLLSIPLNTVPRQLW